MTTLRSLTCQARTSAVVAASTDGLEDDATALVLNWYGGRARTRDASAGTTTDQASS